MSVPVMHRLRFIRKDILYGSDTAATDSNWMPSKPETYNYFIQIKQNAEKRVENYYAEHHI